MSDSPKYAININFLRSREKILPSRFAGDIFRPDGKTVGQWIAHICEDPVELRQQLALSDEEIAKINSVDHEVWPLAFLNGIKVDENQRGNGYGTNGLAEFLTQATTRGCRIALLRIGWDDKSPMERNFLFYQKNGWRELFAKDSRGLPIGEPLSFHDLQPRMK